MPRSRRRGRWQVARNGAQVRHPERPGSARGRRSPGGVNGPFPRRRRPPRPDLPPRGAADQVFTQFVFPPPARATGARGRPHTCPPGPRSRSTGVAAAVRPRPTCRPSGRRSAPPRAGHERGARRSRRRSGHRRGPPPRTPRLGRVTAAVNRWRGRQRDPPHRSPRLTPDPAGIPGVDSHRSRRAAPVDLFEAFRQPGTVQVVASSARRRCERGVEMLRVTLQATRMPPPVWAGRQSNL